MRYANQISEIKEAFSPEILKIEQLKEFYCSDTMEYRMDDKYSSPIEDIFDMCQDTAQGHAFLLLGHKGCGKSTELNRLSEKLSDEGYKVKNIACSMDLDLFNIVYSDIFILMGEALLKIAEEYGSEIDRSTLDEIRNFWGDGTETVVKQNMVETSEVIESILKMLAKIKVDLKYNEEARKKYRNKIRVHSSEWRMLLSKVSEEIVRQTNGKLPIIIFDDLDKLSTEDAIEIFYHHATILSSMPFLVIYTCPIEISHDVRYLALEEYFVTKLLPIIKIQNIDGTPFHKGINGIHTILQKRMELSLFDKGVLNMLIQYTGGLLDDLFCVIRVAAKRAKRRSSQTISMKDAEIALEELKTSLTRQIDSWDYGFLAKMYEENKKLIEDKQKLMVMLQSSIVLEYSEKCWHNVHPLVVNFLKKQKFC